MFRHVCAVMIVIVLVSSAQAANVLLLGDTEAETQVQQALEHAGHNVIFGGVYYEWDGISPNVDDFDVVVYLDGESYGGSLQATAASAIEQFVANGGGLIFTEWTAWDVYFGYKSLAVDNLMPAKSSSSDFDFGFTWQVVDRSHPLASGLPANWFDEAGSSFVEPKPGTCVVIEGSNGDRTGNPLLSFSSINGGTVVYINHDLTYSTDIMNGNALKVIVNSVSFAVSPKPPGECNVVVNSVRVLNSGFNDAWYNPDTSGQGFFISVFPNLGVASLAWFTYDTDLPEEGATANLGDPGHRWLTAVGPTEGNYVLMNIEMTSGGLFDSATEIQRTDPPGSDGTITLTFDSCNSGTVEYDIPSINRQGIIPIQRVADDNIALCEALNSN